MNCENNRVVVLFCMAVIWPITLHAQVNLTPTNGWAAFEIVTQGDDISSIADSGYGSVATRGTYDGLGCFQDGPNLRVWLNHETNSAAISRVDLDRGNFLQAIQSTIDNGQTGFPSSLMNGMGYAYDSIFDSSYNAVSNPDPVASGTSQVGAYGDSNFDRFCSGTTYSANTFGQGRGFVDDLYLTGEEVTGGQFYALDQNTRQLWQVSDFGDGRWENGALIDTGNSSHIAMLLNEDVANSPGAPLRMYVGEKGVDVNGDGSIDLLERNGLRGGNIYYFDPEDGASMIDLPDGMVDGSWTENINDALTETKLEDIHTNPLNGTQVVFAGQNDGVYRMEFDLLFDSNGLDAANSTTSVFQIDDDDVGPIESPDNLTWSANGMIYVQEDGSGNGIFQMNADGTGIVQMASAFSEPSGIIDISQQLGYLDGSVFLVSVQGNVTAGAQLIVLVSPNAMLAVPEPASIFLVFVGVTCGFVRTRRTLKSDKKVAELQSDAK